MYSTLVPGNVLEYQGLYCITRYFTVLPGIVLDYQVLYYNTRYYCTNRQCTILECIVLDYCTAGSVMYNQVFYCSTRHFTVLQGIQMYQQVLQCTTGHSCRNRRFQLEHKAGGKRALVVVLVLVVFGLVMVMSRGGEVRGAQRPFSYNSATMLKGFALFLLPVI